MSADGSSGSVGFIAENSDMSVFEGESSIASRASKSSSRGARRKKKGSKNKKQTQFENSLSPGAVGFAKPASILSSKSRGKKKGKKKVRATTSGSKTLPNRLSQLLSHFVERSGTQPRWSKPTAPCTNKRIDEMIM